MTEGYYIPYIYSDPDDDNHFGDEKESIQRSVIKWIETHFDHRKNPNYGWNSYTLKHILQADTDIYLTNNQFKEAMETCGYGIVPRKDGSPNCHFCISEQSIAIVKAKHGVIMG